MVLVFARKKGGAGIERSTLRLRSGREIKVQKSKINKKLKLLLTENSSTGILNMFYVRVKRGFADKKY